MSARPSHLSKGHLIPQPGSDGPSSSRGPVHAELGELGDRAPAPAPAPTAQLQSGGCSTVLPVAAGACWAALPREQEKPFSTGYGWPPEHSNPHRTSEKIDEHP